MNNEYDIVLRSSMRDSDPKLIYYCYLFTFRFSELKIRIETPSYTNYYKKKKFSQPNKKLQ